MRLPRILITGKNGQVGYELSHLLGSWGELVALDRSQLDLTNRQSLVETVRSVKPNIIINAAAYTAVDKAESEPDLAYAINATAPGVLAEEAKRLKALVIHYSTDYVFDGSKSQPYVEEDKPNPLNTYGHSKLQGEQAIQAVGGMHIILRTSWVYGARGKNFLLTMLRLAKEKKELRIVADQIGAPTWCRTIAQTTAKILSSVISSEFSTQDPGAGVQGSALTGIYHLTSAGQTSWHGFASRILQQARSTVPVIPITTDQYPLPAQRPKNSLLDHTKLECTWNLVLPSWEKDLKACLAELDLELKK